MRGFRCVPRLLIGAAGEFAAAADGGSCTVVISAAVGGDGGATGGGASGCSSTGAGAGAGVGAGGAAIGISASGAAAEVGAAAAVVGVVDARGFMAVGALVAVIVVVVVVRRVDVVAIVFRRTGPFGSCNGATNGLPVVAMVLLRVMVAPGEGCGSTTSDAVRGRGGVFLALRGGVPRTGTGGPPCSGRYICCFTIRSTSRRMRQERGGVL